MAAAGIPGSSAAPWIPRSSALLCCLLALTLPGSLDSQRSPCREHQYRFQQRCCSDCAPGQRMRSRCTATADTVCSPCQDEYFSSEHHHGFCRSCTVCNPRQGSVEVKKCEKTSDRVCMCQAGFMPAGLPLGSECSRCPEGTFSRGRNENCQPWTNCSSSGQLTLRAGTASQDSVCGTAGDSAAVPVTSSRRPFPSPPPANTSGGTAEPGDTGGDSSATPGDSSATPGDIVPSGCQDASSPAEPSWGSLSLLVLCLLLLLLSGISIALLIAQAAQREPSRALGSKNQKERSCRIPIQEEQMDSNSSLIKS